MNRDLPEGKGGWSQSSPAQGLNQMDLPVLLYFSLSLVSLNPFHGAGFTQSLKSPLSLSQGEILEAQVLDKTVSRSCSAGVELLCGLGRVTLPLCAKGVS